MQDVSLQAQYIIIISNGTLQIGTEKNPFMHKATIKMYGSVRTIELPIYGSKVIALRNGTIDMHGAPVGVTWTHLDQTAYKGDAKIILKESVSWSVGSKIVISTTGDNKSQKETEVRTITSVNGTEITLDSPLNYIHLSENRTVFDTNVLIRAEVGLLTRNILFEGLFIIISKLTVNLVILAKVTFGFLGFKIRNLIQALKHIRIFYIFL